ncbi:MAG: winged helix-turn-helix domain-containing protein [Acidobacteriota bacterium]|nr:winged helix-turn-helix domain-containing protein [Acidobacteriota bacterium]
MHVWGYRYTGDARTIDVHVCRLRRKLPALRGRLVTLKHIGYRLVSADESATRTTALADRREPAPRTSARQIVPGRAVRATRVAGS